MTNCLSPGTRVHDFILITVVLVLEYFISNEILIIVTVSGFKPRYELYFLILKQEVLGKTNRLLSFDTIRIA
jgi:hypothetical protein